MLGALIIAVTLVVRSALEEGPRALKAEVSTDVNVPVPSPARRRKPVAVAEVEGRRRPRGIQRDFFVWTDPGNTGNGTASPKPVSRSAEAGPPTGEELVMAMRSLVLQAIVLGMQPKAFIDDRLVAVGDTIDLVGYRNSVCEVKAIHEDAVLLVSGATSVVLRLAPTSQRY